MSVPVTTRLDEGTVDALNAAVEAGLAPDRASAVAMAVDEWLDWHDRARIAESYARAYTEHPQTDEELAFSTAAARALLERARWRE